ncbi:transglutaminaseTgpA domain-containing protein [Halostella litorea]|uniref:transglutaminaseTgpA domain-containing protein n=1 Tax=Halostella litorea TaxID=2528831 RepID=UPI001092CD75|nr:transglutaminaseTgpA domain-containing protein [Halostella litorea]
MSARTAASAVEGSGRGYRLLALGGVAALTASYVAVLHDLATIVGDSSLLLPVVAGSALLGAAVARSLGERAAATLAACLGAVGYGYYLLVTPGGLEVLLNATDRIISDVVALLTGYSVLRLTMADVWSLGFAPAPVFLSWYFAVRRRYVPAVAAGGAALLVLVLTGDAGIEITLLGVLGGVAAVGFGELDRRGGSVEQADVVVVLVVAMAVASLWVPAVGGDGSKPLFLVPGGGSAAAGGGLAEATDRMTIQGETELSPTVRFTVESERAEYWRVATYDRYTGDGWIRSGKSEPYDGQLLEPPGPTRTVEQRVTVESPMRAMPAAASPVAVRGDAAGDALVTDHGGLATGGRLAPGATYTVESEVLTTTPGELRRAGTEYPDYVRQRDYTQLPDDTPARLGERTAEIAGDETNPYDKAVAIEEYLEANKEYSLDVDRPDGNVADAFLFEMDAGYCTYYATTMTAMLRSQGIPARMVTGYTPGQDVGNDTYVVRGVDAHAWVEVYFPDNGWVRFDPTPSGDRSDSETETVQEAREDGADGVDTDESAGEPLVETTTAPDDPGLTNGSQPGERGTVDRRANMPELPEGTVNGTLAATDAPNTTAGGSSPSNDAGGGDAGPSSPDLPSPETVAWALFVGVGLVAGAHRAGVTGRAYGALRLHWQGDADTPAADAERAGERLDALLAREYRPRRPGETPREYVESLSLAGLDDRAHRVARIRERARYGDGVSREEADEAIKLVDDLVAERTPLLGRIRRLP